jgi:hypothetical protein
LTTEKQKAANRRNAKKSTGPKTSSGKKRSSQNAISHGVLTDYVGQSPKEKKEFEALHKQIRRELKPKSQIEILLVERYVVNFWRERRLSFFEEKLLSKFRAEATYELLNSDDPSYNLKEPVELTADLGPFTETPIEKQLLIARYQTMLNNQSRLILKELRDEQSRRLNSGKVIDEKGNVIG